MYACTCIYMYLYIYIHISICISIYLDLDICISTSHMRRDTAFGPRGTLERDRLCAAQSAKRAKEL